MSNRYSNPVSLMSQAKLVQNDKLFVAREFLKMRLVLNKQKELIKNIEEIDSIQRLLSWEGNWYKKLYAEKMAKRGYDVNFKRDFNGKDSINERLNILNNAFYTICSSVILSCSLSPSMGFMHGYTRRGGLAFDFADIFKYKIILDIAFSLKEYKTTQLMHLLSKRIKKNNGEIGFVIAKKHNSESYELY